MAAKPALKPVPAQAQAEAPAAPKKKLLPIIVIAVLVAFLAGGAAWHFLGPKPATAEAGKPGKPVKAVVPQPSFMTLETFTVNLAGAEHFLQLGVVLQLDSEKTADEVKTYLPRIRNDILLLLSSKTAADLDAPGGKQKLADEILAATRKPLDEETRDKIQGVLFSSLVVQ
jgi:flagellar FliL protein